MFSVGDEVICIRSGAMDLFTGVQPMLVPPLKKGQTYIIEGVNEEEKLVDVGLKTSLGLPWWVFASRFVKPQHLILHLMNEEKFEEKEEPILN